MPQSWGHCSLAGSHRSLRRLESLLFSQITNRCSTLIIKIDVLCPSDTTGNAQYDQTRAGNTQTGVCQGGTYGSPTRRCVQMEGHNSEWQTPAGTCSNIYCAGITLNNATFPDTASGESKYGNCIANYRGSPLRDCLHNGTNGVWTAESGGSGCVPITCDAHEGVSGIFPSIQSGTTVIGTCPAGYGGTPNATCSQSGDVGIWGAVTSPCQGLFVCSPKIFPRSFCSF